MSLRGHEEFMRLAMDQAHRGEGTTSPYPSVGCVIVKGGRVVGRGFTQPKGREHAEVHALKRLGNRAKGATLYSTLEPCHHNDYTDCEPCSQWIVGSGIRTVVWGARDPNPKNAGGCTRWLSARRVRVIGRVLQKECEQLHEVFLVSLARKRPFVLVSTAVSLDGKITWQKGKSSKGEFSSGAAFRRVHDLRSRVDAIGVGITTIQIDNPRLTARVGHRSTPARVIIDSHCETPVSAKVFEAKQGAVIVVTTAYAPLIRREELVAAGAQVIVAAETSTGQVNLKDALKRLYQQGITSLMIEGGGELIASALKARLVDKVYLWYAPLLIGGRDTPTLVEGEPLERLSDATRLKDVTSEKIGNDILIGGYIR
ncbi:bifunctional diaminohydroxyphosphoribosylaminopyrimidine deaminase/5-amino-6-(5-phosphoribosylamino)uracil reductase RibD [Candidatus Uhrbacteria bacterium]|nr:bifunctional diaminohydroxyphosphoribosylaminopyrimidine deaminase/5-amino-6-(5-phosphoribosylamino)uracil reductase RibD [Candidatus Uhrbacteria bacterium]